MQLLKLDAFLFLNHKKRKNSGKAGRYTIKTLLFQKHTPKIEQS
jgi:hypothetical protein